MLIEVDARYRISVRTEVNGVYHRYILSPGDNLVNQPPEVIAKTNEIWTQEIIDNYKSQFIRVLTLDEQIAAINAKYQPQLETYKDKILTAMASDGVSQASKVTSNQALYNALVAKKNNELAVLLNA